MKKIFKILALIIIFVVIVGGLFHVFNQPPSIDYLKEHPNKYRFENYWSIKEFHEDLKVIFPVGTPKDQVDQAFLNAGAEIIELDDHSYLYRYSGNSIKSIIASIKYMSNCGRWSSLIIYDENNELIEISSKKLRAGC